MLWTHPQHNANYGDPEVPTSRKPTRKQLKTVVFFSGRWHLWATIWPVLGRNIWGLSPPLLFPFLFPSIPLNTARGSGKLPERGLGRSPSGNRILCILALKSDIWWHQNMHGSLLADHSRSKTDWSLAVGSR